MAAPADASVPLAALEPEHYPFLDYRAFTFSLAVRAGDAVWLSGSTAARFAPERGKVVVEGDLVDQARLIFEKMRLTLEAGGLNLAHLTRVQQYVTPEALPALARLEDVRREVFGTAPPPVATLVVNRLLRARALIEIEGVAAAGTGAASGLFHLPSITAPDAAEARARAGQTLRTAGLDWSDLRRRIELAVPPATFGAVSEGEEGAVLRVCAPVLADGAGGVQMEIAAGRGAGPLFLAGEGDPAEGGVVEQCRALYARLTRRLAEAGLDPSRVAKTSEFITPDALAAYRGTADVRREVFAPPFPAATGVVCEGLVTPGARIAVEMVAVPR